MALLVSERALAQCTPAPSQAGQPVTCNGTASGGYTITTSASPLTVTTGSSLANSGGDALSVNIPASGPYVSRSATITVDGTISSGSGNGIMVLSGPSDGKDYDFYGTSATISVASGASVSGVTGINAARSPGYLSGFAPVSITIDNAGTITGTGGVAIANSSASGYSVVYNAITNESSGFIGAIDASFSSVINRGTINGGGLAAIATPTGLYGFTITNGGTITSANGTATIDLPGATITNTGTVANTGSGAAILGQYLSVTNSGTVSVGAGNAAINASGSLNLVNSGTIDGNVLASGSGNTVDSSRGTINGNLVFGNGSNTLIATLANGTLQTGVNGTITGGSGSNTLQIDTSADTTLAHAVSLPTNFTQLAFVPTSGTTLTLANGFSAPATITLNGSGTLTNATSLSGSGTIIASGFNGGTLDNTGSVTSANASGPAAVTLSGYSQLINTGTITASGAAVTSSIGGLTNSGTITAGGTAVYAFVGTGTFANTGSIVSTGGTAVDLWMGCTCDAGTNSGLIKGATVGLNLSDGILVNTGSITSSGYGVALGYYGTLENKTGGVITGGSVAIGNPNGAPGLDVVSNAGTINGNVMLSNSGFGTNTYFAMTGGVLNGNLTLGAGDKLVTDLVNTGSGAFAGITGSVNANGSYLIYNLAGSASATAMLPAGFVSLAYQLSSQAALTLTTSGTLTKTLGLAGSGTLIFNGSLATTNAAALQSQNLLIVTGYSSTANALTITNNGTISATHAASPYSYFAGAVSLDAGDTLINNGTISLTDTSGNPYAAVAGGQSVTNTGTIIGNNASAVSLNAVYTSSGTSETLTNSGIIASTGASAITSAYGSSGGAVINAAGGTISAKGDAIAMTGGLVSNAGTIDGNVDFGSYGSAVYVANGGVLNGNLSFGYGSNALIETGSGYGITGAISLGGGTGYIGHLRNSDATVTLGGTLPSGFTGEFVLASGAGTHVTITGPASSSANIVVGGDGAIINQANTSGTVLGLSSLFWNLPLYGGLQLESFTNQAAVGGIDLAVNTLVNSGTVSATPPSAAYWWYYPNAIDQSFSGTLSFTNTGQIAVTQAAPYYYYYWAPSAIQLTGSLAGTGTVNNSGIITGTVLAAVGNSTSDGITPVTFALTNSGTITGSPYGAYFYQQGSLAVDLYATSAWTSNGYSLSPVAFSLVNSGAIVGDITMQGVSNSLVETASGSIAGNLYLGASGAGSSNTVSLAGAFAGSIQGTGSLALTVSGGSAAAPIAFGDLAGITSYSQSAGYATIGGTANLASATINGGSLTGLVGSTINAPQITVGAHGSFGSGGTVNGNLLVGGTLRVGASPDTLTLNGNVSLAAGSTTVFEVSPTASSKLVTTGSVTIAPGAALQIAALQPVMPGTSLQLISAAGGVSGSFTSFSGITGKLNEAHGALSLLVLFDPSAAPNAQVGRAIAYVNNVLSSAHTAAFDAALPSLTAANGAPVAAAFARLSPEPYASAEQIAVESGLTLAEALRNVGPDAAPRKGALFTFGEALGDWRALAGDLRAGSADSGISGAGVMGGLGVAGKVASLALFGGYLDQTQSIGALGASTEATGLIGGVTARLAAGPAQWTVSLVRDGASARTQRALADGKQALATYDLHSWTLDAEVRTHLSLGEGWQAGPHAGTSWIWTNRAAASENAASPFALSLAGEDHTAGFVDGGLRIETAPQAPGRFSRFIDLGLRWQIQGKPSEALAGFAGQPLTLLAVGDRRSPVSAVLSSGCAYAIAPGVSLFLNGEGELTEAGNSVNANGGIRMLF